MRKDELKAVKSFQDAFEVRCAPVGAALDTCKTAVIQLNHRLCNEEITETLVKGVQADDLIEIADGCADSIYVIAHAVNQLGRKINAGRKDAAAALLSDAVQRIDLALQSNGMSNETVDAHLAAAEIIVRGVAAVYDIPLGKVFAEVHRSNMTKTWDDGKGRKDAGGKIIKPPGYSKPDVAGVLAGHAGQGA